MTVIGPNVILSSDRVFQWVGPSRRANLFGTKLGKLVLTDQHLVFLSSGMAGWYGQFAWSLKLDESALSNKGSLAVELDRLTRYEYVKVGRVGTAYLSISFEDADGSEASYAFMNKLTLEGGSAWTEEIDRLRAPAAGHSVTGA